MGTDQSHKSKSTLADPRDNKSALSCAECRRSKVKCDRIFPCSSCVRRGCAELCPDGEPIITLPRMCLKHNQGTLPATKGNKALIAYSQELSEEVRVLTQKVQVLQNDLSKAQDELKIIHNAAKRQHTVSNWDASFEQASRALGSLSINSKGSVRYRGETSCIEYLQEFLTPLDNTNGPPDISFPSTLEDLMDSFPLGHNSSPPERILELGPYLPSRGRAMQLVDLYYTDASWMGEIVSRAEFIKRVLDPVFQNLEQGSLELLDPHSLSLFFILIATGTMYDNHPFASSLAIQYNKLARAALCLEPIRISASYTTVQAFFMIFIFSYLVDRSANEERWLLMGLCCRLAQRIGLQRDCGSWEKDPGEIQQRRMTFWALFNFDRLTSVFNGRPPVFDIRHTDCRFPDDVDKVLGPGGEMEMGWNTWAWRFSASCLSPALQLAFNTRPTRYEEVLALDRKVREYPLPSYLKISVLESENGRVWSENPTRAMQQFCALCEIKSVLLNIHRSYFAQAINQEFPLKHKYAFSILSIHKGASTLASCCRELYLLHPALMKPVWQFWSTIFSAGVMLGAIVIESPGSILAESALYEFERLLPVYEEGSRSCRSPATYGMLQKLLDRATLAYNAFQAGVSIPKHNEGSQIDELDVLEGRRTTIDERRPVCSPSPPPNFNQETQRSIFEYYSQNFGFSPLPVEYSPLISTEIYSEPNGGTYSHGGQTTDFPLDLDQFAPPPQHSDLQTDLYGFPGMAPSTQGYHTRQLSDQSNLGYYEMQPYQDQHGLDQHPADVWQSFVRRLGMNQVRRCFPGQ